MSELCSAAQGWRDSVTGLADVNVITEGTNGVKVAVDELRSTTDALKAAGGQEFAAQIDALQSAVDDLESSIRSLGDGTPSPASLRDLTAGLKKVADQATTLRTQIDQACP